MGTERDENTPACRIERGYDTHVKVYPKEFYSKEWPETSRLIKVVCTKHNLFSQVHIKTKGLSGVDIRDRQNKAFDLCFESLEGQCHGQPTNLVTG